VSGRAGGFGVFFFCSFFLFSFFFFLFSFFFFFFFWLSASLSYLSLSSIHPRYTFVCYVYVYVIETIVRPMPGSMMPRIRATPASARRGPLPRRMPLQPTRRTCSLPRTICGGGCDSHRTRRSTLRGTVTRRRAAMMPTGLSTAARLPRRRPRTSRGLRPTRASTWPRAGSTRRGTSSASSPLCSVRPTPTRMPRGRRAGWPATPTPTPWP
jgi:hypothetical protein